MGCDGKDRVRPVGPLPNGYAVVVRHRPDHAEELAVVCPAVAGRPLAVGQECVVLSGRGDGSYEITDSYVHGVRSGPVQVATEKYRTGWDQTFTARGIS
jgi:hypothetical protein